MKKIAIVLLNYLNYRDTLECVESIFQVRYLITGIVIVDNNSNNNSYKILSNKYKEINNIIVIKTRQNLGFAKGNNIGIKVARERFKADFVFVCNNDILFMQKDFFKRLLSEYKRKVAVIGPVIYSEEGKLQNRCMHYVTLKEMFIQYAKFYLASKDKGIWINVLPPLHPEKKKQVLHGCALLFTPYFFEYYQGFYPKTFLYCEEEILYFMCGKYGLEQKYAEDASICHKENQSSEISFQNDKITKLKYQIKSYKYAIWWNIKMKVSKRFCKYSSATGKRINGKV